MDSAPKKMTLVDALGYAIGLLDEIARGGVDEAELAYSKLSSHQGAIIRQNVRRRSRQIRRNNGLNW